MRQIPCIWGSTGHEGRIIWSDVSLSLEEICQLKPNKHGFLVVFIDGTDLTDLSPDSGRNLSQAFNIPSVFWTRTCRDACGFFWAGNDLVAPDEATCDTTAFCFLVKHNVKSPALKAALSAAYQWQKLAFVTYQTSHDTSVLLCFDLSSDSKAQIRQRLVGSAPPLSGFSTCSVHIWILTYVIEALDDSVWSWRDVVRDLEAVRRRNGHKTLQDFDYMHDVARHLIHCSETLSTALSVVDSMIKEHGSGRCHVRNQGPSICLRELEFIGSIMRSLLHRSNALEKRMDNEIALAFHANAQHDTLIASGIAESAQRDGRITKGISILGMLFLPGTYISAIFSMSFFNYTPGVGNQAGQWTVSTKFWMYWAVTIPVTLLTIGMWLVLQHWFSSRGGAASRQRYLRG